MELARRAVKTGGWDPRASDAVDLGTGPGICTSTELPGSYLPLPSTSCHLFQRTFLCFPTFAADFTMPSSDHTFVYIRLPQQHPSHHFLRMV